MGFIKLWHVYMSCCLIANNYGTNLMPVGLSNLCHYCTNIQCSHPNIRSMSLKYPSPKIGRPNVCRPNVCKLLLWVFTSIGSERDIIQLHFTTYSFDWQTWQSHWCADSTNMHAALLHYEGMYQMWSAKLQNWQRIVTENGCSVECEGKCQTNQ